MTDGVLLKEVEKVSDVDCRYHHRNAPSVWRIIGKGESSLVYVWPVIVNVLWRERAREREREREREGGGGGGGGGGRRERERERERSPWSYVW